MGWIGVGLVKFLVQVGLLTEEWNMAKGNGSTTSKSVESVEGIFEFWLKITRSLILGLDRVGKSLVVIV